MTDAAPLLKLESISKIFGGLTALTDVSFEVAGGEVCGVIGPNGAGKTTLFNMIAGSMPPSSGHVIFAGADVSSIPMHKRTRKGIVRTFQLAHTFESMTVEDNVLVAHVRPARSCCCSTSPLPACRAATSSFSARPWRAPRRTARRC
jgi:branched-chain amino acid transport system ATP-binding protein